MTDIINRSLVMVDSQELILKAVEKMIENNVSCVLVIDEHETVVGIVTERDIVRKFTLLDMADKLERNVSTIMSRPVTFVSEKNLVEDIKRLYFEKKVRHFPVTSGKGGSGEENAKKVVGIVSITDFFKHEMTKDPIGEKPESKEVPAIKVGVVCKSENMMAYYQDLFNGTIKGHRIDDIVVFVNKHGKSGIPVIFDLDGYHEKELRKLIPVLRNYKGLQIVCTANPGLAVVFKKLPKKENQYLVFKPIDAPYCRWLIRDKIKPA